MECLLSHIQIISSLATTIYLLWKHYHIKSELATIIVNLEKEIASVRKKCMDLDDTVHGINNVKIKHLEQRVDNLFIITQDLDKTSKGLISKIYEKSNPMEIK